jgi:hypothetical protein
MKRIAGSSIALLALTVVASASAGDGSTIVHGYGGKAGQTVGSVLTHKSPGSQAVHTGSTLPFTGLSLVGFAAVAALLVLLGLVLVRMSRRGTAS